MSYHYLRDSNQGCCDCLGDFFSGGFGESCSKSRLGMTLLFLWVIILTIVCFALGSNIGKEHVLNFFYVLWQNLKWEKISISKWDLANLAAKADWA